VYNADTFHPGWLDQDFPSVNNEIALSYGFIISEGLVDSTDYASVIGENITITFSDTEGNQLQKTYLIVGTYDSHLNDIVLAGSEYVDIASEYSFKPAPDDEVVHFVVGEKADSLQVINYLFQSDYFVGNIGWDKYQFSVVFCRDIGIIALILGGIMFVLSVGLIAHFVTLFISDNRELTGILLALGATKKTIFKIYLWRSCLQMAIVLAFVIPLLFLYNHFMNGYISNFNLGIVSFYVNIFSIVVLMVLCLLLYVGFTLLPLRRFFKKDINALIYDRQ